MERRDTGRRAAAGVVGAAALALALTGCGAGQDAETSEMVPAISGVDADAGTVALRDLQIDYGDGGAYPEGGQAPLRVWIGNNGEETVVLEAVTSPDADTVLFAAEALVVGPEETGSPAEGEESESPGAGEGSEGPEQESPSADASATPGGDASGTPGESEPAEGESGSPEETAEIIGESVFAIEIPAGDYLRLAPTSGSFLLLDGLKEAVEMGSSVELEFAFSNGETVTVAVPMGAPETPGERSYFEAPHEPAAE
ncbi:copper chaperone PCu(A)C [Glycomyces terrestris]|uniref:Copper chaperone PCu(A)C n=1 Tax=Glycomyces terrestris TaxID=2493553 RepID=A0A426UWM1_9ACTN|nr:copper chaperone PCu(A)C [Glycomyces terrestris]RRR98601.1 copper chaperone PCu(A)C [Glycomyces terrestris]